MSSATNHQRSSYNRNDKRRHQRSSVWRSGNISVTAYRAYNNQPLVYNCLQRIIIIGVVLAQPRNLTQPAPPDSCGACPYVAAQYQYHISVAVCSRMT